MLQPQSWLPEGGQNLFQAIKAMCAEAEAKGIKLWKLTIGQPSGPAAFSARQSAALVALSDREADHEYQDNGSPFNPEFARRFVLAHLPAHAQKAASQLAFLPIPGIKPMLGLVPLACGAYLPDWRLKVGAMTKPGYPTPADWCHYLNVEHYALNINPGNQFRFRPGWLGHQGDIEGGTRLLMANFPHNPTGQIATQEYWREVCNFCAKNGIRLFNDAAYAFLTFTPEACTLAEVASGFPDLSWAEAFSASKLILNGTGWRVGAIVGSPDFVGDIATIKGNTDSGLVPFAAAGVLAALENDRGDLEDRRALYKIRLEILYQILQDNGLRPAVKPQATFFSLWLKPRIGFGQGVLNSRDFNQMMIAQAGIAGVHFVPDYIRYAVAGAPLEEPSWQEALNAGFRLAQVLY